VVQCFRGQLVRLLLEERLDVARRDVDEAPSPEPRADEVLPDRPDARPIRDLALEKLLGPPADQIVDGAAAVLGRTRVEPMPSAILRSSSSDSPGRIGS